jgi:nucleoside 2-deoxyribosyltransferase
MEDFMEDVHDEFEYRRSFLNNINYSEAENRLLGFLKYLQSKEVTSSIINEIKSSVCVDDILKSAGDRNPPNASTPAEFAAVGLFLLEACAEGKNLVDLGYQYGIEPSYSTSSIQDHLDEIMRRYINPTIDYIGRELVTRQKIKNNLQFPSSCLDTTVNYPLEITESLQSFFKDHPDCKRNAFVMMRFGKTEAHKSIVASISATLKKYDIAALRADDKEYHDDLFPNVLTYIYGCHFGIAVFERLEQDDFNPNVSLEVGYMRALHKPICLLKDKTLKALQTDLVGKLYKAFDPQNIESTIPIELGNWLRDKDIITL